MNRDSQGTILLVIGVVVGRLTLSGGFQSYVKSGLYWPLLASAAALIAVGGWSLWTGRGDAGAADDHGHLHAHADHRHSERIGWLLLAPIAVLLLVAPAPLGAFAAQRDTANRAPERVEEAAFPPLPEPRDGAVNLTFTQLLVRTLYDDPDNIVGVHVRLTGFVAPADEGGYRLTRFVMGCCAADGAPIQLHVATDQPVPPTDTWLEAVVAWNGDTIEDGAARIPVVELHSSTEVPQPEQPYEY